ncbi:MAG: HAD-IA family hydrolase [Rhodospirillales bacterium]|nr:HAD-IA family hydrolase [Rhodospirillales bacterium]
MSDRLVIFDCDGVLVDSEALSSRVMAEALTELGYPVSADDCIRRFTGISMATLMERVEADWGRSLPPHFESDIQERDFAAFRAELAPVDGVEDALATMSHAKCVASSGAVEKMHLTLSITGLLPYFEPHLFSSSMVRRGKPAPDLFLFAAARMGYRPEDCWVVEDSVAGVTAAVAAGMHALGFWGAVHTDEHTAQLLCEAGATRVFARMSDLPRLLADGVGA